MMNEDEKIEFFYEIFYPGLPRLGPGDDGCTRKALRLIADGCDPGSISALDLGCGNGGQTIQLALAGVGSILALDNHRPYLDELERRAAAAGVGAAIETRLGDMLDLDLEGLRFDLVWSEGALFVMGFESGLKTCLDLLAPDGFVAVSELCWIKDGAPPECRRFFESEYPAMVDVEENLRLIRACGYDLLGHFTFPESSWWEPYYLPLEKRLRAMAKIHAAEPEKLEMLEGVRAEIEICRDYSEYYGNVFFVMKHTRE